MALSELSRALLIYVRRIFSIGLPLGFLASRSVGAVFFDVRPTDLSTYVVVTGITLTVGLLAAILPARRASRVDPQITLRNE